LKGCFSNMKPNGGITAVFPNNRGDVDMETISDSGKLKEIFKQAIIEAIEEKKEVVHDLLVEALEDVAMIRAIQEGEDSGFVGRDEIFGILSGSNLKIG